MCLAVPMQLVSIEGERGRVELQGVGALVMLTLTPEAKVGEYVIVHAGYALSVLDSDEAECTLRTLRSALESER
ncbi:HypC/HybG/HupF family hydrogenase formation chaperone [candidate division KSB1 bacterium]|nr:HypC/HybG/HupF family hydrogenase formation chaperone [candidate division KSB1 bacterium]